MEATETVGVLSKLATFMSDGGAFMWVILAIWGFGIVVAVERFFRLYLYDTNGTKLMEKVRKDILENKVQDALGLCSKGSAVLTNVFRNALKRANKPREKILDAVDAASLEAVHKVEKRMNYLALVANISTLVGLLGTIHGLIDSFSAVAAANAEQKAELLAMGISKAMNTTAFGLISAISIMVLHTILTTKGEKILAEMDEFSMKLVDLLGTKTDGGK